MLTLGVLLAFSVSPAEAQATYQEPPDALARLVDAPLTPGMSLSPDQQTMLLLYLPSLSPISELAEPEMRLAGIRIA